MIEKKRAKIELFLIQSIIVLAITSIVASIIIRLFFPDFINVDWFEKYESKYPVASTVIITSIVWAMSLFEIRALIKEKDESDSLEYSLHIARAIFYTLAAIFLTICSLK